ncbi:hypothetical protein A2U01_0005000 [Trifolium medium]|uniref:Uncharacterized protein n=1 Tax=Trifolium medium TaxID=97028 RepID=A0A392MAJ3_9FABA|nr:hypothetical protein [Trifolium medium]
MKLLISGHREAVGAPEPHAIGAKRGKTLPFKLNKLGVWRKIRYPPHTIFNPFTVVELSASLPMGPHASPLVEPSILRRLHRQWFCRCIRHFFAGSTNCCYICGTTN